MVMDAKKTTSSVATVLIFFYLMMIFTLIALFLGLRQIDGDSTAQMHDGPHILMLLPGIGDEQEAFRLEAQTLADRYNLRIEMMDLATVSAQKQMLSIVPQTDVDAVLLWAVTSLDDDYGAELTACRQAGIPVVLIDQDFEDKTLRNSFVGSGINSEQMVINQTMLWTIKREAPLIIGSCSHAGNREIYELLVMNRMEHPDFDSRQIWSARLKSFVNDPPNEYYAKAYIQISSDMEGSAALNLELIRTLQEVERTGLFFSLEPTLTNALAAAIENNSLDKGALGCVIGYGDPDRLEPYIEKGIIDELIVSDVLYSAHIGLRYLADILRGFYVPDTLDSGIKLITR